MPSDAAGPPQTSSSTPSLASAPAAAPKSTTHARSQSLANAIARGEVVAGALPPLLAGIAKKAQQGKAKPPIDAAWVANLQSVLTQARAAQGQRATAIVAQKQATADAHRTADALAAALSEVRSLVAIHNPDDVEAQLAFGRGMSIDGAKNIPGTRIAARAFVAAYADRWKTAAAAAGVTPAMIASIASMADEVASATTTQHAKKVSGADRTLTRGAAVRALRSLCAFAVKVVQNVYGKGSAQLGTLDDPRPKQGRAQARKAAARAKAKLEAAARRAKKAASRAKPGARSRSLARRTRRASAAERAAALVKGAAAASKKPAKAGKATAKAAKATGKR
jgi:hypothetical protein